MKKTNKILSIVMIMLLLFVSYPITTTYAASATLSSSKTVTQGENVTVTASVTANTWALTFSGAGQEKYMSADKVTNYNSDGSESITFVANEIGNYVFTLKGHIVDASDEDTDIQINETCTITVVAKPQEPQGGETSNNGGSSTETPSGSSPKLPQETNPAPETQQETRKSSNNYLSSLSVSAGKLTPEFSRERLEYSLEFEEGFDFNTLNTITVQALAEDSRSKVGGTGEVNVTTGENNIEVDVMAEDSSVRTYKISFIKPEVIQQSDLRLSSLVINTVDEKGKIKEVELTPKFDKEIFEYELEVTKDIEKLEIDGQVENENIVVAIDGADNLHTGKNLVKITLTSPTDETIKSVYQITVNKEDPLLDAANENSELKEKNKKKLIIGLVLAVIAVLAVALVVLLIINHRKNKKEQAGNEEDEEYDKYNQKPDEEELEEKKKKLFDYDEEDTYLTDKNLEKLSDEFKETAKKIEDKEKAKNASYDKLAGLMESERLTADEEEVEEPDKVEKEESAPEETKSEKESMEEMYEKDDAARTKKLEELEKEIKAKRRKTTRKSTKKKEFDKDEFLDDIKKKKDSNS